MKKLLTLIIILCHYPIYANNDIFKCVDQDGNINYLNATSSNIKKLNCSKLSMPEFNSTKKTNSSNSSIKNTLINSMTYDEKNIIKTIEQDKMDSKRKEILTLELNNEKKEISSINTIISNLQIENSPESHIKLNKLYAIKENHLSNILALEKALGH